MKIQIALLFLGLAALMGFAQNAAAPSPASVEAKYEVRLRALELKVESLEARVQQLQEEDQRNRVVVVTPEVSISGQKKFQ